MNSSRFQDDSLRPTYMSQSEANDLMELWAERQREEAARHSLITVHDVAEATQLSVQDVERLLQDVRAGRGAAVQPTQPLVAPVRQQSERPTIRDAYLRLAPFTAALAVLMGMFVMDCLHRNGFGNLSQYGPLRGMCFFLFLYAFVVGAWTAYEYCGRWLESRILNKVMARRSRSGSYGAR